MVVLMTVNTISPVAPSREAIAYELDNHGAVLITKAPNRVGMFTYTMRPLSPRFVRFILFCERFFR
jgi:hypothetical protein